MWNNHLCTRFGKRYIDEITVAEIQDYLEELYYTDNRAYSYTESFLKMFYLIFGQAYSRNYIDVDSYNKLCVNKDTKIHMPKLKIDDDLDIVSFDDKEIEQLDNYFSGTNAETAYMLGKYCGLRINECYGLKWSNVDLKSGIITIDRQMQYQEGLIKLVSLKTITFIDTQAAIFPVAAAQRTQQKSERRTYIQNSHSLPSAFRIMVDVWRGRDVAKRKY